MKLSLIVLAGLAGMTLQATAAELACWNLFAASGTKPYVTATVADDTSLTDVKIDQTVEDNQFDTNGMVDHATGKVITAKTSPYKATFDVKTDAAVGAGQEFVLADGVRLVLPDSLMSADLKSVYFQAGNLKGDRVKRQNGVLDVDGDRFSAEQGGDTYFRLHCSVR